MKRTVLTLMVLMLVTPAGVAHGDPVLDGLLSRAAADGLPVDALRSKVREGQAKRIPEARVRAVVQQLMQHMQQARAWLREGKKAAPPSLMVAVAQARMAGLAERDLKSLVPAGSGPRLAQRVDTLVDLRLRGYRTQDALQLVRGVAQRELAAVGGALDGLRRKGELTHSEAVDALLRAVRAQKGSVHRAMQSLSQHGVRGQGPPASVAPAAKPKKGR